MQSRRQLTADLSRSSLSLKRMSLIQLKITFNQGVDRFVAGWKNSGEALLPLLLSKELSGMLTHLKN